MTESRVPHTVDLRLPWHRETVGHESTAGIAAKVAADLNVPLAEGLPPNTDATWIVNAENKIVAFVGNGPRQTDNADAIIEAVEAWSADWVELIVQAEAAQPAPALDAEELVDIIEQAIFETDTGLEAALLAADRIAARLSSPSRSGEPDK